MKKIWLVRHGQSKAQTGEEVSCDANLSDLGKRQAERLDHVLSEVDFDRIFISPLRRARQTFEATALPREKAVFDSRLVELLPDGYGQLLPYDELPDYAEPDAHDAWNHNHWQRISSFLSDLIAAEGKNYLVVGHAMALNALICLFLAGNDLDLASKLPGYCTMHNAAISIFDYKEKESFYPDMLLIWNYQRHLEAIDCTLPQSLKFKELSEYSVP